MTRWKEAEVAYFNEQHGICLDKLRKHERNKTNREDGWLMRRDMKP
jgi:hypothetical protein